MKKKKTQSFLLIHGQPHPHPPIEFKLDFLFFFFFFRKFAASSLITQIHMFKGLIKLKELGFNLNCCIDLIPLNFQIIERILELGKLEVSRVFSFPELTKSKNIFNELHRYIRTFFFVLENKTRKLYLCSLKLNRGIQSTFNSGGSEY